MSCKLNLFIAAGALPALSLHGSAMAGAAQSEQKNILLIIADDMRPELGCYGASHIISPNIDRIAASGALFTHAYSNIPVSGASRASLLTGLYPALPSRFASFDAWVDKDAPQAVDIAAWFRSQGYTAISNGKVFHNLRDRDSSWSEYPWRYRPEGYGKDWAEYNKWELWLNDASGQHINPKTKRGPFYEQADVADSLYDDVQIARKTVADLKRLGKSKEPFFMAVGFWRPHLPFNAPKKYWDMYDRGQIALADNRFRPEGLPQQVTGSNEIRGYALAEESRSDDFHRLARHGYYACISFIDAQIGAIMEQLQQQGLDKNTVVVVIGDHGWHLGEHEFWGKHNLMNRATTVPMIISVPDNKPRRVESIAQFVDIFPTLCAAAGISAPSTLQGKDLMPTIEGKAAKVNDYAFIQWGTGLNIVTEQFSYALWPSTAKSSEAEMLFDMRVDPAQNANVANDPQYARQKELLRQQAESFKHRN